MYIQSKKALSVVIGYVLLVVIGVALGAIVYTWQKTYVPKDEYAACPEGVSLFLSSLDYDHNNQKLTLEIKNNGRFSVGGYFIYIKDDPEKTLATVDVSEKNLDSRLVLSEYIDDIIGVRLGYSGGDLDSTENEFLPNDGELHEYDLSELDGNVYGVEIVPIRWQKEGRKIVLASCQGSKIFEPIN